MTSQNRAGTRGGPASFSANALAPCNPYRYRVTAVCADTTSPVSDWLDFSTTGCDSCGIPDSLRVTGVTSSSATLEWNPVPSTIAYGVLGGPAGGGSAFLTTAQNFQTVGGLSPGTDYEWQVAAWCGIDTSDFSGLLLFSTPGVRLEGQQSAPQFAVFPNPASDFLFVPGSSRDQEAVWRVSLTDLHGRIVMVKESTHYETLKLDLQLLPAGAYLVTVQTGSTYHEARISVQR